MSDQTKPKGEQPWEENISLHVEVARLREQIAKLKKHADPQREDPEAREIRRRIFRELRKLLPEAVSQAKKGKPALLRLITRSVKTASRTR